MCNMRMKACPVRRIAVLGGGNIGTQFACVCAAKGWEVNVCSSRPECYDGTLEVVNEQQQVTTGKIRRVTPSIPEAMEGCEIIFVTQPAFMLPGIAKEMLPGIRKGMMICVLPGTGGAEFAFRDCILAGAVLIGFQRVPGVARLEKYGKRVRCEGLRPVLHVASIPREAAGPFSEIMSDLWGRPCRALPNYLSVTLTPSNPILHTTRLRTLFADYEEGKVYPRNPLFYGEWSDASSALLMACDSELQEMIRKMDRLDLSGVKSLRVHYESDTPEAMTAKLRSIRSLHNLASPMKRVEQGWIPDFSSRYFTADFPYGLAILEELADVLDCEAENIRSTMEWYRKTTADMNRLDFGQYGIHSLEDLYALY